MCKSVGTGAMITLLLVNIYRQKTAQQLAELKIALDYYIKSCYIVILAYSELRHKLYTILVSVCMNTLRINLVIFESTWSRTYLVLAVMPIQNTI